MDFEWNGCSNGRFIVINRSKNILSNVNKYTIYRYISHVTFVLAVATFLVTVLLETLLFPKIFLGRLKKSVVYGCMCKYMF